MSDIKLTPTQLDAMLAIVDFLDNFDVKKKPFFILAGYAGCGKTTIISELVYNLKMYQTLSECDTKKVAVATLTWKAANVLRQRGLDKASSIHSLIYNAEKDPKTNEITFHRKSKIEIQKEFYLIIIDEASMTDTSIRADLATYEIPILYIGDSFQLPSISKDEANFLANPDVQLTEILRQALDNPIIQLSMAIRQGQTKFPNCNVDNKVFIFAKKNVNDRWLLNADQVIVGYNKTRIAINNKIRTLKGHDPATYPAKDEKLISLSNCREKGIFNGQAFTSVDDYSMQKLKPNEIKILKIQSEDSESKPHLIRTIFTDHKTADYTIPYKTKGEKELVQLALGYTITTHKSQGSQWPKVVVYNEMFGQTEEEKARWLYTSVTRSIEKLILLQ